MSDQDPAVDEAVVALERQEQSLLDALRKIEDQLVRVRRARASLVALQSEEPLPFDGNLATAIRIVLSQHKGSMKPVDVRDAVKKMGYTFREDSNQMAAVHGVLKRMAGADELKTEEWKKERGVTRYFWNPERPAPTTFSGPVTDVTIAELVSRLLQNRTPKKPADVTEQLGISKKPAETLLGQIMELKKEGKLK